jgi:hypothetical protein
MQVLMMVKTESEADLSYLDKLIERNPEYTKRDLSTGEPHRRSLGHGLQRNNCNSHNDNSEMVSDITGVLGNE